MLFKALDEAIDSLIKTYTRPILDEIKAVRRVMMATFAEVNAKMAEINQAITDERNEVQALLEAMRQQIQALQDQIASGVLVDQGQVDSLAATADSILARVKAISEPV